jgi:hypothetical protein
MSTITKRRTLITIEVDQFASRQFDSVADAAEYLSDLGVGHDLYIDLVGDKDGGSVVMFPIAGSTEPVAEYRQRAAREHRVVGTFKRGGRS